ncbi:hypothetical protein [Mariniflexile sp. HMF6888]|uniref:hypothetical protein n=1 Tax=Mariniflexile sp. HMF6888 TaxID=3373086 RepID=UPI0037B8DA29
MDNFRYRPKDNFIQEASLDDLLALTKNWESDLIFYNNDLKFLQQLIEVHFVKLLLYEGTNEFRDLQNDIQISIIQCEILLKQTPVFTKHLTHLIDEPHKYDTHILRNNYELFEDDCTQYIETVKIIRLLAFSMLKNILEEEKSQYFWKFN